MSTLVQVTLEVDGEPTPVWATTNEVSRWLAQNTRPQFWARSEPKSPITPQRWTDADGGFVVHADSTR